MAKKGLSYGPNTALIKGARDVAQSQAMRDTAGGIAFAQEFTGAIKLGIQEQEKSKAIVDAYSNMIKTPDNITLLDEQNKPAILDFVRQTRSNVVELAKAYAKTKDANILDDIQMEKAKIVNLSNQINGYIEESKLYIAASDKNQIARGKSFDYKKYDNIFSKNAGMKIEANGDLSFGGDKGWEKFNDITGKWNVVNNVWGKTLLSFDTAVVSNASKGRNYDKTGIYNNTLEIFKAMGPEEVQVALEQDVTGDAYENLSFEAIWSGGKMDPKFYKGFEAFKKVEIDPNTKEEIVTYDSSWMFDNNNVNQASHLMSVYTADVLKSRHDANFLDANKNTLSSKFPSLGSQSYTTGPGGSRVWTNPGVKQEAFNFFSTPQKDGTTYDGTHAYYVQTPEGWHAYSSIDDYKKDKASNYKEKDLRKGTYSINEVFGFETGLNISGGSGVTSAADFN